MLRADMDSPDGRAADDIVAPYDRTLDDVYRYASRLTGGDRARTDELVQETYLTVLRQRDRSDSARTPDDQHAALVLRYVDDLAVADVAAHLDRSVRATESLLVRARAALRTAFHERTEP